MAVLVVQIEREMVLETPAGASALTQCLDPDSHPITGPRLLMRHLTVALAHWNPMSQDPLMALLVIHTLLLWAGLFITGEIASRTVPRGEALAAQAVAAVWLGWGFLRIGYGIAYIYDLPVFFFHAAALWAILARKTVLLAVILVLGTLNKETTIWLVPAYLLCQWEGRWPSARVVGVTALLAAIVAGTYLVPRHMQRQEHPQVPLITVSPRASGENPGDPSVPRWRQNVAELGFQGRGGLAQSVYWALALHLPALVLFGRLPRPIRRIYMATPVFVVALFFLGNIWELRLWNELVPLGAVGLVCALHRVEGEHSP
jgi:hypothetical protein